MPARSRLLSPSFGLILVLALAASLRLAALSTKPIGVEIDGLGYWCMASHWVDGQGFVDNFGNRAFLNPGYGMLLAPMFALFGSHLTVAAGVNVVLGLLSVWLCFGLGRALAGWRAGLLAALFWAWYPHAWVYGTYVAKENLQIPLLLSVAWASVWARQRVERGLSVGWVLWWCGVLTGAVALTSATGMAVGGWLWLWVAAAQRRSGRSWSTIAGTLGLWAVGLFLVTGPWMLRNHAVLGRPVLNTNGGLNLHLGNRPKATLDFRGLEGTEFAGEWARLRAQGGELAANDAARARAWRYIQENPGLTLQRIGSRWLHFWKPPALSDREQGSMEWALRWVWRALFLGLGALALAAWRFPARAWPWWVLLVGYALAHAPFFVMPRFQLAAVPFLCVLAGLAVFGRDPVRPNGTGPRAASGGRIAQSGGWG